MFELEIVLLANNCVLPFQDFSQDKRLNFVKLNKLFTTHALAEHGLGFLLNLYEINERFNGIEKSLIYKVIFDMGSNNLSFLHNVQLMGYQLYDVNSIVISHWHYDHIGALSKILEQVEDKILLFCHENARLIRVFKRSKDISNSDLLGKTLKEIKPFIDKGKLVIQDAINVNGLEKLNAMVKFMKNDFELFNNDSIRILVSGEIPRKHDVEDFDSFYAFKEEILQIDKILDDKFLIIELENQAILLNGCCHSGLMNSLDHATSLTNKPIRIMIGGFHMASVSEKRMKLTISYLKDYSANHGLLYLFPIHCSGEIFLNRIRNLNDENIISNNISVCTTFKFLIK
ncbi:MAG: MBL fold metallo-hydrolase [Promethearchaeota archaeon]